MLNSQTGVVLVKTFISNRAKLNRKGVAPSSSTYSIQTKLECIRWDEERGDFDLVEVLLNTAFGLKKYFLTLSEKTGLK